MVLLPNGTVTIRRKRGDTQAWYDVLTSVAAKLDIARFGTQVIEPWVTPGDPFLGGSFMATNNICIGGADENPDAINYVPMPGDLLILTGTGTGDGIYRQVAHSIPDPDAFGGLENFVLPCILVAKSTTTSGAGQPPIIGGGNNQPFTYTQTTPSTTWVISHNLARIVYVEVVDSADTVVEGVKVYQGINQVTLEFSVAFSGKAYLFSSY